MQNEEKRFKIEKIEKYEKEIKGVQLELAFKSFVAGAMALTTTLLVSTGEYSAILPSVLSSGTGALYLFSLVDSIIKKTNLKLDLNKLKDELKMEEHQEIKRR